MSAVVPAADLPELQLILGYRTYFAGNFIHPVSAGALRGGAPKTSLKWGPWDVRFKSNMRIPSGKGDNTAGMFRRKFRDIYGFDIDLLDCSGSNPKRTEIQHVGVAKLRSRPISI